MDIVEVPIEWTPVNGRVTRTVLYFPASNSVPGIRVAIGDFCEDMEGALTTVTSWRVATQGRAVRDTDGGLVGVWSDGTQITGTGSSTAQPVADATQGLIRFSTGVVVGRRYLQGRAFIPGIGSDQVIGGNLTAGAITALGGAAGRLRNPGVGQVIWHRPQGGAGGAAHAVTASAAWSELAVLRRRRG